jgi:hypothetical protein
MDPEPRLTARRSEHGRIQRSKPLLHFTPSVCSRHRPLLASRLRIHPPALSNTLGSHCRLRRSQRPRRNPRPGRNNCARRLQRPRQHGRHLQLHPLPAALRRHDQAAKRARRSQRPSRSRKKTGRHRARLHWPHRHLSHDRALAFPRRRSTQQGARRDQSRGRYARAAWTRNRHLHSGTPQIAPQHRIRFGKRTTLVVPQKPNKSAGLQPLRDLASSSEKLPCRRRRHAAAQEPQ